MLAHFVIRRIVRTSQPDTNQRDRLQLRQIPRHPLSKVLPPSFAATTRATGADDSRRNPRTPYGAARLPQPRATPTKRRIDRSSWRRQPPHPPSSLRRRRTPLTTLSLLFAVLARGEKKTSGRLAATAVATASAWMRALCLPRPIIASRCRRVARPIGGEQIRVGRWIRNTWRIRRADAALRDSPPKPGVPPASRGERPPPPCAIQLPINEQLRRGEGGGESGGGFSSVRPRRGGDGAPPLF